MSTYTPIRDQLAQLKADAEACRENVLLKSGADRLVHEINVWLKTMSPQQQYRKFTIDEVDTLAQQLAHIRLPQPNEKWLRRCEPLDSDLVETGVPPGAIGAIG